MVNSAMTESGEAVHRQRLRERFLAGEAESRSEEALLELLLTFVILHKNARPLAQELLRTFGSFPHVLSASSHELSKVKGLGQASIALLKVIDFIQSGALFSDSRISLQTESGTTQQMQCADPIDSLTPGQPVIEPQSSSPERSNEPSISAKPAAEEESDISPSGLAKEYHETQRPLGPSSEAAEEDTIRRKFQVSNSYLLKFDQLSRVLNFLLGHKEAKKINRKELQEDTGMAERHVENLISMGAAMGLIKPGSQVLTPAGLLIAEHDIFFEKTGTLEWCHYEGAGTYRNLIWFEIFNSLLVDTPPMTQEGWNERMRSDLAGKYTEQAIKTRLHKEIRFIVDAYLERNFSRLELLQQSSDGRLYRRRYTTFSPLVLSAMIYDFCAAKGAHLFQVGEMAATPGSPAVVFGLDVTSFRQQIEGLHERGWLRYETTHNLDQIRLKPDFSALEFLTAHFNDRDPRQVLNQSTRGIIE